MSLRSDELQLVRYSDSVRGRTSSQARGIQPDSILARFAQRSV
jgi:hypothetical protein